MTVPKERRCSHTWDDIKTKETALRRVYEMSKPGAVLSMADYLNYLVKQDGLSHPEPKKKTK